MRNTVLYQKAVQSLLSSGVSSPAPEIRKASTKAETPFGQTLNELLGAHSANEKVSEEDLFAAAVGQQIKDQMGDEVYDTYKTAFQIAMTGAAPGRSLPSSQYSARQAVHYLVLTESMTRDESKAMRGTARASAQLDDDDRLFDGYAGPGEDTKAISKFSEAQQLVVERLAAAAITQANITATVASQAAKSVTASAPQTAPSALNATVQTAEARSEQSSGTVSRFSARLLS